MAQSGKDPVTNSPVGDRCFEENWRAARRALYRHALRLTRGDPDSTEDLLSVTAIKSLEILRRIPERIRDPQAFLFFVLHHVHLDSVRRNTREKRIFDTGIHRWTEEDGEECAKEPSETRTPLDGILVTERLERVSRAVHRLTSQQRQLFELAFLHEHAYPEIAETLRISPMLARKRMQLLRKELRRLTKSSQD